MGARNIIRLWSAGLVGEVRVDLGNVSSVSSTKRVMRLMPRINDEGSFEIGGDPTDPDFSGRADMDFKVNLSATEFFSCDVGDLAIQIGGTTSAKVGFHGLTPVVQRASGGQASITNNTGATADDEFRVIREDSLANASTDNELNWATAAERLNEIRTVLLNLGLWKGSA